jgi:galactitol-specific phosphotransferase system IIC component
MLYYGQIAKAPRPAMIRVFNTLGGTVGPPALLLPCLVVMCYLIPVANVPPLVPILTIAYAVVTLTFLYQGNIFRHLREHLIAVPSD